MPSKIRNEAKKISLKQKDTQQARQVELNYLAVYAANFYLSDCLEIETDLTNSDSQNIIMQSLIDVADLNIVGLGKLECRPILKREKTCHIPSEVWENRIGYLIVEIDEEAREANLLGFIKQVNSEEIAINSLQSLDDFLLVLEELFETEIESENEAEISIKKDKSLVIKLTSWLKNEFEDFLKTNWLPEAMILAGAYRGEKSDKKGVSRGKVIDLGMNIDGNKVTLIVTLNPRENEKVDITFKVYPANSSPYLPPHLKLIILDENGEEIPEIEVQSRSADNWIQQELEGEVGDKFGVKIVLGDICVTEDFIV